MRTISPTAETAPMNGPTGPEREYQVELWLSDGVAETGDPDRMPDRTVRVWAKDEDEAAARAIEEAKNEHPRALTVQDTYVIEVAAWKPRSS